MDHGFDDFNVTLANWPPKHPPDNYVALDLPSPNVITYIPPLEGVIFGPGSSPRFGRLPENHVLEYKVRDASKVILHSPEKGTSHPQIAHKKTGNKELSEYPRLSRDTELCGESVTYYFGVRLSPDWNAQSSPMDLNEHAKEFFNDKVLPSLYEKPVPEDKKLLRVGLDPYHDRQYMGSVPTITPAVFRYSQFSGPHIIAVNMGGSGGPLCLSPAATGTTVGGKTTPP